MAKTKISEFSATPANNTDIDSINIAEGCAPSGINDAIRELMAQLKDFQTGAVGDSFNGPIGTSTAAAGAFTTLSASSTTTLSGLTASTALALDASKNVVSVTNTGTGNNVLATSPTLVTPILGTPTSATLTNATGLPISTGVSGLGTGVATFLATPSSANLAAALTDETGSGANVFATSPTLVTPILGTPTSATLTNATGLPLTTGVTGTLPTANGGTNLTSFTSGGVVYASSTSALATGSALVFNGTNLGVGVTPSAWGATYSAFEIGSLGNGLYSYTNDLYLSTNAYFNVSWKYATTGYLATRYNQSAGKHIWETAPSGTAGNTITFSSKMTFDTSGNLLIGATTGTSKLVVGGSSGTTATPTAIEMDGTFATTAGFDKLKLYLLKGATESYGFGLGSAGDVQYWAGSSSTGIHRWFTSQTEQMRLTTTGLGIGTSSPAYKLDVTGSAYISSKLLLDTGSVSAPSLTFLGWTNSGIYNPDGNSVAFTVNGTQRGKFSTTGLAITGTLSASSTATFTTLAATAGLNLNTDAKLDFNNGTTNNRIYMNGGDANIYFRNITTSTAYIGVSANGIDLNGGQLKFPATQSASSDANTLDDYEEGTWTPAISGITSVAYTQQYGNYIKIGKQVTCFARLLVSGTGSGADVNVTGLPFTSANAAGSGNGGGAMGYKQLTALAIYPHVADSSSTIQFYLTESSAPTAFTLTGSVSGYHIFYVTYLV